MSKDAKLARQDGDGVSDRHTHVPYKSKKSRNNNDLEDPILVVNHCVGINLLPPSSMSHFYLTS